MWAYRGQHSDQQLITERGMDKVYREYEIREGSTEGMHYRIEVYDHRFTKVEDIQKPTMQAARDELRARGYRREHPTLE